MPRLDVTLLRKRLRAGGAQRIFERIGPSELAQLLLELPPPELKATLEQLCRDRTRLTQALRQIPDGLLLEMLANLGDPQLARLLGQLEPDDGKHVAQLFDEERRLRVIELIAPEPRAHIERLLRYSADSAGGRMIPRFASVRDDMVVGEAIVAVRSAHPDVPLFYLYILDAGGKLVGVMSLSQLVKAPDDTPVVALMTKDVVSVSPDADQEAVAHTVRSRNLLAVPVVQEGRLLGLVTIDDVIDVLEQEATEDMYNMAGLSEGDRVFSPPLRSLGKRLPWNALNLMTSLAAASVVALFEGTIAQLVVLATFMPVVASIGGNTGNQTLTVILRGITLGELEFSSALRALVKEMLVGLSIGLLLGSAMALVAILWKGNPMLGAVIAMAMVANLLIAAFVGTAIPLTLKKLGYDPALGGSILVTMCTDVFGFLCFLGLATVFMKHLL